MFGLRSISITILLLTLSSSVYASDSYALPFPGDPLANGTWESLGAEDGIDIYRKELKGTDVYAVRGDIIIDEPIDRVAGVIYDHTRWMEWTKLLKASRMLSRSAGNLKVVYQEFDMPAFIPNRDVIYAFGYEKRGDGNTVVFEGRTLPAVSREHTIDTVGERMDLIVGRWTLVGVTPTRTALRLEVLMDPKGWLPSWVVNLTQRDYPVRTLQALRRQAARSDIKPLPMKTAARGDIRIK